MRLRTALVADDCSLTGEVHAGLLQAIGYRTTLVASGNEAALAFQRATVAGEPFDLVLLDHDMPDGDGPTAARLIRALEPWPRAVPMLCVTGRPVERLETACLVAGFDRVLAKPLTVEALRQSVVLPDPSRQSRRPDATLR